MLNLIDEFTRKALGSHVARRIGAKGVRAHLERMFALHGKPAFLRADNGREFIAASLVEWLEDQGVKVVFIAKASPWQNGINERFNGTMERELFGHEVYHSILEIQYVVDAWTEKYNTMRVHRALAGQTPAAYAKMLQQAGPADQGGGSK